MARDPSTGSRPPRLIHDPPARPPAPVAPPPRRPGTVDALRRQQAREETRRKLEIQALLVARERAAAKAKAGPRPLWGGETPPPAPASTGGVRPLWGPVRPRDPRREVPRGSVQAAGLVPEGRFVRNLSEDAFRAALGFVPGLIGAGQAVGADIVRRDPRFTRTRREVVAPVAESYAYQYGPLVRGDVGEARRRFVEHPLGPILDVASVASLGTAGAARAGLVRTSPRVAHINVDGGKVQRYTSPNPLARVAEEKLNRLSERMPGVPVVGARSRAARAIRQERELEMERTKAELIPFDTLARKLKKRPAQNVAYDVIARYGDRALERIDQEIAWRRGLKRTVHQRNQLVMLRAARKHVERPSPLIVRALEEGRGVTEAAQADLIALGQLTPETAAAAIDRHSRLVTGGAYKLPEGESRYAPTAAPEGQESLFDVALASVRQDERGLGPGALVTPDDRRNIGRVVAYDPDSGIVGVHFLNRQTGARATAQFREEDLRVLTPEEAAGSGAAKELVGGEPAGEGAFYMPDVARQPIKSLGQRVRSVTGKPRRIVKRSEGILFTAGRIRRGAQLATESALRAKRAKVQLADIDQVDAEWARPLVPTPENPRGLLDDHTYFNPEGYRLPRRARDELELDLTPQEWAAVVKDDADLLTANVFPVDLPSGMERAVKQVPSWVKAAYEEGTTRMPGQGAALSKAVAGWFKLANNVFRLGAIYLKPAYAPVNFTANELLAITQQGVWHPVNLAKAAGVMGDLAPNTLRRLDVEVGGGGALAVAGEAQGITGAIVRKVADVQQALADKLPRRTAIIHELGKRGYKSDADINSLLDDLERRPELNVISRDAENAMVRFRGLSPGERSILTNAVAVYPWIRGSTAYTVRLPIDHPVKADVIAHIGMEGYDDLRDTLGQVADFLRTRTPVGDLEKSAMGELFAKVVSPDPASAFGTSVELGEALWGALTGKSSVKRLADFGSPAAVVPAEMFTGYDTFSGRPYPQGTTALDILLNEPKNYALPKFVAGMIEPPEDTRYFEAGGRRQVAQQFGLGPLFTPRTMNVTEAREEGEKQRREAMDLPASEWRYRDDLNELYRDWPALGFPGEPPREITEDLLWRKSVDMGVEYFEGQAKGEKVPAEKKARLAGALFELRYPQAGPQIDRAFANAKTEREWQGIYESLRREGLESLEQWTEEQLAALEERAVAAAGAKE